VFFENINLPEFYSKEHKCSFTAFKTNKIEIIELGVI
jgi:hypothetical protein